jgi:hypothetical protein
MGTCASVSVPGLPDSSLYAFLRNNVSADEQVQCPRFINPGRRAKSGDYRALIGFIAWYNNAPNL